MLKQLFTLFLICYFTSSIAQSKIDVLGYSFTIELNDDNNTIKGVARINFIAKENLNSFSLDLSLPNRDRKGMIVSSVDFNDSELLQRRTFKQEADKLIIDCQHPIRKRRYHQCFHYLQGHPFRWSYHFKKQIWSSHFFR